MRVLDGGCYFGRLWPWEEKGRLIFGDIKLLGNEEGDVSPLFRSYELLKSNENKLPIKNAFPSSSTIQHTKDHPTLQSEPSH